MWGGALYTVDKQNKGGENVTYMLNAKCSKNSFILESHDHAIVWYNKNIL